MSDTLCKFCGQVYDMDRLSRCPQCSLLPEHMVCQECGNVFNPRTVKNHKCPSCGKTALEGWENEHDFQLNNDKKENPGILFPGSDGQKEKTI